MPCQQLACSSLHSTTLSPLSQPWRMAQAERQQDTLYGVDFQLVVLERKVARAHGKVSREEAERLAVRIKELSGLLASAQAEQAMLTSQVKRVDDDCGELPAQLLARLDAQHCPAPLMQPVDMACSQLHVAWCCLPGLSARVCVQCGCSGGWLMPRQRSSSWWMRCAGPSWSARPPTAACPSSPGYGSPVLHRHEPEVQKPACAPR